MQDYYILPVEQLNNDYNVKEILDLMAQSLKPGEKLLTDKRYPLVFDDKNIKAYLKDKGVEVVEEKGVCRANIRPSKPVTVRSARWGRKSYEIGEKKIGQGSFGVVQKPDYYVKAGVNGRVALDKASAVFAPRPSKKVIKQQFHGLENSGLERWLTDIYREYYFNALYFRQQGKNVHLDFRIKGKEIFAILTLPCVGQQSFDDIMTHLSNQSFANRIRVGNDMAKACVPLMDLGIMHGDLKPLNMVYDQDGNVSIVDFGTSQRVGEKDKGGCTLKYVAPERATEEPVLTDCRSDLFSLGVMLSDLFSDGAVSKDRAADGAYLPKKDYEIPQDIQDKIKSYLESQRLPPSVINDLMYIINRLVQPELALRPSLQIEVIPALLRLQEFASFKYPETLSENEINEFYINLKELQSALTSKLFESEKQLKIQNSLNKLSLLTAGQKIILQRQLVAADVSAKKWISNEKCAPLPTMPENPLKAVTLQLMRNQLQNVQQQCHRSLWQKFCRKILFWSRTPAGMKGIQRQLPRTLDVSSLKEDAIEQKFIAVYAILKTKNPDENDNRHPWLQELYTTQQHQFTRIDALRKKYLPLDEKKTSSGKIPSPPAVEEVNFRVGFRRSSVEA